MCVLRLNARANAAKRSKVSKTFNHQEWIQTSRAAGALVLLSSIRQGLGLHRDILLTRNAGNGAKLAFTLDRAITGLRAV